MTVAPDNQLFEAALATARTTFAGDRDVLAQLDADATDLKIK
jgi:hypothetical protein